MRSIPESYNPHRRRVPLGSRRLVLQDRDVEIVRAVHENRVLTKSLLVHFFPPTAPAHLAIASPKTIGNFLDRRLAKLFHSGYLDRLRTVRGGELIYAVTTEGLRLIAEHQPQLPLPPRADNARLTNQYLHHALLIAHVRAALAVACRSHPDFELDHFERESLDLKATWRSGGATVYVNPDAYFVLRHRTGGRAAFFLEADRGTMPVKRATKGTDYVSKFAKYCEMERRGEYKQFGEIKSFRMLTVTGSAERANNILDFAAHDPAIPDKQRDTFYFTVEKRFAEHPVNIFARIWKRADDPRTDHAIVPSPLTTQ